ncbi:MAG: DNA N-6-adenine-methyltransferase [Leptolyngbyaceae cyanobacterium]
MTEESILALAGVDVELLESDEPTTGDLQVDLYFEQANTKIHLISQAAGQMLFDARDCGRLLLKIKERCPHGSWLPWLAAHFHGTARQAQKYMRVAFHWDEIAAAANLYNPSFEPGAKNESDSHLTKNESDSRLSLEGALSLIAEPREAPQLPPAPIVDFVEGEIVEEEELELEPPKGPRLDNPNASNEHYTPDSVLAAVYECFGGMPDLDPCSDGGFPPSVNAGSHFTAEQDGLSHDWFGRVFVNPPYNPSGTIGKWVKKLLDEIKTGRVNQAILLVPAYTDTGWWAALRDYPVCLVKGRLTFKGNEDAARFPSAIFYLGHNANAFGAAFHELGDFWMCSDLED